MGARRPPARGGGPQADRRAGGGARPSRPRGRARGRVGRPGDRRPRTASRRRDQPGERLPRWERAVRRGRGGLRRGGRQRRGAARERSVDRGDARARPARRVSASVSFVVWEYLGTDHNPADLWTGIAYAPGCVATTANLFGMQAANARVRFPPGIAVRLVSTIAARECRWITST